MVAWKTNKILVLGEIQTGSTPKTSIKDNFGNAIPFIKPADFQSNGVINYENDGLSEKGLVESRLIKKNSVLMVCIGATIGKVGYTTIDVTANQQINSFTPHKELLTKYCYYAMLDDSFKRKVIFTSSQATLPIINKTKWSNLELRYPEDIEEQKRIVAILDQAFADIEQARAKTEQNLKNARELFESYLQQVFSQRGEGWKVSKLIDIANVVDSLHKTPKYSEDGYPMVRVTDVRSGSLDLSNTRKVDKSTYDEFSKKYKAKIGDIVFSRVGSYGRSSIVTTDEPFCLGQNTVFLAPSIDGYYFYYFLNSQYAKNQIDKLVSGSTQPTVSLKSIKSIDVPVPPENKQLSIVKKVDGMSKKIIQVEELYLKKLYALDELKKSILQKVFTGELTRADKEAETKTKGVAA